MAFAGATLTLPCQFIRESDARSTRLDRQFVTGEVAVPMVPKRALTLAQELIEPCRGDRNHHSSTRVALKF